MRDAVSGAPANPMTNTAATTASTSRARVVVRALGVLAVLGVLALLLQPWWLAPLVGQHLSASARRDVHFDSMWLTLSGALQPAVHFRGVRVENAPWADTRRPFAVLGAATVVFSWSSVRERRPVVAELTLRDGEVDLERRADGLRNWRLANPDARGPGRYKVLSIRAENATVRFRHERLALELEARASANREVESTPGGEPMPTRLGIRGTWREVPFVIDAATSDVLTFVETGRSFRVRGQVTSGKARLDLDGRLGDIVRDPLVDARFTLTAPSLAPFAAVLPHPPDVKAIAVTGEVKGEPGRYALAIARGRLGATDVAGELDWKRGAERDLLRARLTSDSATLSDLRALAGRRPAKAAERAAVATMEPASAAASASQPVPARPVDAELSYAVRRLHGEGMPWLQGARIDASLADGRLSVSHFDVGIAGGRAVGKGVLDTANKPMHADAEVDVSAIRVESLLPSEAARNFISGTVQGRAALKASGDSIETLLAGASGTVSAFVGAGTVSSLLDAKMGLQGGRIVRGLLAGAEPIALRCAAAVLDLERGRARIRTLVVDTERTRTIGTGSIDLTKQALDVILTPEAKQPGLFVLDRSIHLHGPLRGPQRELVPRVVPAGAPVRACPAERP